jgi:hypothetical protein
MEAIVTKPRSKPAKISSVEAIAVALVDAWFVIQLAKLLS